MNRLYAFFGVLRTSTSRLTEGKGSSITSSEQSTFFNSEQIMKHLKNPHLGFQSPLPLTAADEDLRGNYKSGREGRDREGFINLASRTELRGDVLNIRMCNCWTRTRHSNMCRVKTLTRCEAEVAIRVFFVSCFAVLTMTSIGAQGHINSPGRMLNET